MPAAQIGIYIFTINRVNVTMENSCAVMIYQERNMEKYIDIHSHIVFGVDDGSADENMTRRMLEAAYAQGVRTICATPHFRPSMFRISLSERWEAFEKTKQLAKNLASDFEIIAGNEIYYEEDCVRYLKEGICLTMGNSRYILVEFNTYIDFGTMRRRINSLICEGYIPVIAHIERYPYIAQNMDNAEKLIDAGAYIQVNASSIMCDKMAVRHFVRKLLKHGLVNFVASDSHNTGDRAYNFTPALKYINKKYGGDYLDRLMYRNPLKMLNDEYI